MLNKFLLNDLKRYWPYVLYVNKANTLSFQDLKKKVLLLNFFACVIVLLILKKKAIFAQGDLGLSTLTPKKWVSHDVQHF